MRSREGVAQVVDRTQVATCDQTLVEHYSCIRSHLCGAHEVMQRGPDAPVSPVMRGRTRPITQKPLCVVSGLDLTPCVGESGHSSAESGHVLTTRVNIKGPLETNGRG